MTPDQESQAATIAALMTALRVSLAAHPDRERVLRELEHAAQGYGDTNLNTALSDKAIATGQMCLSSLIQSLRKPSGTDLP